MTAQATVIIENEIRWVYGLRMQIAKNLHFADNEVETVEWMTVSKFTKLINNELPQHAIDHGKAYFTSLIERLDELRLAER